MYEKRLGISIYPEKVGKEETIEYIKLAHKHGFKRIFANLLQVIDDEKGRAQIKLQTEVFKVAKDLGFDIVLDVNPLIYQAFKLDKLETSFFAKMNVTGIRLDEDFGGEVEAKLTHNKDNLFVELNASGGSTTVDKALEKGANEEKLIACHNFYPMRYTGLKYERFIELSSHFKAKGVRVAAFVTLDQIRKGVGPWNINEGMPSLEEQRDLPIAEQTALLLSLNVVDDIIISQQGALEEDFATVNRVLEEYKQIISGGEVEIDVELNKTVNDLDKSILNFERPIDFEGNHITVHSNRPDLTGYFVRSTITRLTYAKDEIKPKNSGLKLKYGDVVILNENLGRYKGEVHLITKDIDDKKDNGRNLIGRVSKSNLYKLKLIQGGTKFKLCLK